jgi:hypothetical protein
MKDKLIFYQSYDHEEKAKGIDDVENPEDYNLGLIQGWRHVLGDHFISSFEWKGKKWSSVEKALKTIGNTDRKDILMAKFTQIPLAEKVLIKTKDAELYGTKTIGYPERDFVLEDVRDEIVMEKDLKLLKKILKEF